MAQVSKTKFTVNRSDWCPWFAYTEGCGSCVYPVQERNSQPKLQTPQFYSSKPLHPLTVTFDLVSCPGLSGSFLWEHLLHTGSSFPLKVIINLLMPLQRLPRQYRGRKQNKTPKQRLKKTQSNSMLYPLPEEEAVLKKQQTNGENKHCSYYMFTIENPSSNLWGEMLSITPDQCCTCWSAQSGMIKLPAASTDSHAMHGHYIIYAFFN